LRISQRTVQSKVALPARYLRLLLHDLQLDLLLLHFDLRQLHLLLAINLVLIGVEGG
jgi:hypothetical protein